MNPILGASLIGLSLTLAGAAGAEESKPKPKNTITIETTPEFYATDSAGKFAKGDLAQAAVKLGFSHALDNGVSVGVSLAKTGREPGTTGVASSYNQLEVSASYKFKLENGISVSPSATLGYAFGELPKIDPADATKAVPYYAIAVAVDYKMDDHFTWNVLNLRYRNAFGHTWKTPRIATGISYKIDDTNSVSASLGKSFKDTGTGYVADKYNLTVAFKHSF